MHSKKIGLIAILLLTPALYCQQSQLLELVKKQSIDLTKPLDAAHTKYAWAMKTQLPQDLLETIQACKEYKTQLLQEFAHIESIQSELYLHLDKYELAKKEANQALKLPISQQDKARALITLAATSKDPTQKEHFLNQVLSYNDVPFAQSLAQIELGNENYVKQKYALAKAYYKKALSYKHVPPEYRNRAHLNLGTIYFDDTLNSPDYTKAARHFTSPINNGTSKNIHVRLAYFLLGKIYLNGGHGISQDLAKAKEYFEVITSSPYASEEEKNRSLAKIETIQRLLQAKEAVAQPAPAA